MRTNKPVWTIIMPFGAIAALNSGLRTGYLRSCAAWSPSRRCMTPPM